MLDDLTYDVDLADAAGIVCAAWKRAWTLPEKLTVSEHADRTRIIAKGAGAEPGKWHTSRNPPLREIMDCLSDHSPIRECDFMKPGQFGGTEVGINWVNYVVDHAPDSMIVAQPVKDLARSWSTAKFEPAVTLMPALRDKFDQYNTLEKSYPGGTLWVIWSNSANQLRQRTARYLFMDELDEYPDDLAGQGGAQDQLETRPRSYGDRGKIYRVCTPTVSGRSKIHKSYLQGDQRKFMVPCPHCGHSQELVEDNLLVDGTFVCAGGCGSVIQEHHKTWMLRERCDEIPNGAYWKPTNLAADPLHRSYHIWAAYTPEGLGLTWKDIARARAEAESDPTKQVSYANLICARVFEGERQSQDFDEVAQRAEVGVHLGVVPPGSLILTAGVDCQHDRFEVQILGFGRGQRIRVVDYAVLPGDPSNPEGYDELDTFLQRTYAKTGGAQMVIRAIAIDGGNWTEQVAQFVKKIVGESGKTRLIKAGGSYEQQRIFLVRGRAEKKSDRAVYRPAKTEVNQRDKTVARSVGVWGVGTSVLKHIIYGRLAGDERAKQIAEKDGVAEDLSLRMIRFPGGRGDKPDPLKPDAGALQESYFKGLTCEYFDLSARTWIKPKGQANEPLDTFVYGLWAALSPAIKIDVIREHEWAQLESRFEPAADLFQPASPKSKPEAPSPAPHQNIQVQNVPRETTGDPPSAPSRFARRN